MENTLDNKAKFFAQYWDNQTEQNSHDGGYYPSNVDAIELSKDWIDSSTLILKKISLITDDDAIEVAQLAISFKEAKVITTKDCGNKLVMDEHSVFNQFCINSETVLTNVFVYQLLASKGYALPYMGLSVETLVEYGWVKIK